MQDAEKAISNQFLEPQVLISETSEAKPGRPKGLNISSHRPTTTRPRTSFISIFVLDSKVG